METLNRKIQETIDKLRNERDELMADLSRIWLETTKTLVQDEIESLDGRIERLKIALSERVNRV